MAKEIVRKNAKQIKEKSQSNEQVQTKHKETKKVNLLGETDEKRNCEENSKKKQKDVCL